MPCAWAKLPITQTTDDGAHDENLDSGGVKTSNQSVPADQRSDKDLREVMYEKTGGTTRDSITTTAEVTTPPGDGVTEVDKTAA